MTEATDVAELRTTETPFERGGEVGPGSPDVWERVRLRAECRLAEVEVQAHRLFDRSLTPAEVALATNAADTLADELGRLELPSIAQLARHITKALSAGERSPTIAAHIAATTDDIRTLLASAMVQQSCVLASGTVVVVGPNSPELDAICWVAVSRGYGVIHSEDALPHLDSDPVGVITSVPGFSSSSMSLLRAISQTWPVPRIVLHDTDQPETLRELAAFATTLLTLDSPPDVVSTELARAIVAQDSQPTALILGDAAPAETMLAQHGFEIINVAAQNELLAALERPNCIVIFGSTVQADVVLELGRLIRATPALRRTPLVWLCGQREESWVQATRLDIFAEESVEDGLAARLGSLVRSGAADLADVDRASQSVLEWTAAQVLVDRSLVAAYRRDTQVALATVNLANDLPRERLRELRRVLGREFRRGDIVSARNDHDFVVVLAGVSRRVATNRMTSLMDRLDLGNGQSHVGIAMFPTDGRSAHELACAADTAREAGFLHDGPTVVSTTWRSLAEQGPDTLVVAGDPVLGSILVAGLAENDLRAELVEDGREALQRLIGPTAQALPRLLLLDLDAPGLDGLSLLRRLRGEGVLSQLEVLLMTARSSEADLRLALDLGVSDVIEKPFSTTLFMHRVGRLLEDGW